MRQGIAAALAVAGSLLLASSAQASFHLMKISEVGQGDLTTSDFVELQMYSSAQNLVAGKQIRTYSEDGTLASTFTFPTDVANGQSQRTILVYHNLAPPPPGVVPDVVTPDLVLTGEGAVCFGGAFSLGAAVDCVSYGSFEGVDGGNPSPVGAVTSPPAPGESIHRSIAPGCATLLEASDDTDDSATDFAIGAPTPRGNATEPTETACEGPGGGGGGGAPDTEITKAPKKKTPKAKAKFKFRSDVQGAEFECKLDGAKFKPCSSPRKYKRLDRGKHRFQVRAIVGDKTDPTPAKHRWKVTG